MWGEWAGAGVCVVETDVGAWAGEEDDAKTGALT